MGNKNTRGFTLVELMIVLTLIAILAVIAIYSFGSQIFKANDAKRKADLNRIKIAAEEYEKDHNCYPPASLMYCNVAPLNGTGLQPYLDKIPCDPVTNSSYYYQNDGTSCSSWFRIYTKLDYVADPQAMPWCGGPSNNSFNYYIESSNAPTCVSSSTTGGTTSGGGTATPTPSSSGGTGNYYGCVNGVCVSISWDSTRPGPACDPNYQSSDCYGQCGPAANECKPWH